MTSAGLNVIHPRVLLNLLTFTFFCAWFFLLLWNNITSVIWTKQGMYKHQTTDFYLLTQDRKNQASRTVVPPNPAFPSVILDVSTRKGGYAVRNTVVAFTWKI